MSSRYRLMTVAVVIVVGALTFSMYLAAQSQDAVSLRGSGNSKLQPIASRAARFGESIAARDLPAASESTRPRSKSEKDAGTTEADDRHAALPRQKTIDTAAAGRRTIAPDGALQATAPTPQMPSPAFTFEGLGQNENSAAGFLQLSPSDANGDVGPNHYVQQTNLLVRVYDKSGNPLTAPFKLSSLFQLVNGGPGGECAAGDDGDPIVLYDPLADRWLLSEFAFAAKIAPPYHECIAISQTSDPSGAYYVYDFVTPNNEFPADPKLAMWPDGYYMSVNQYTNFGPLNGTGMYAFNRLKMLAGDPTASYIYFDLDLTSHPELIVGGLPADLDGLNPPPAGAPNIFAYFTSTVFGDPADGIRLFNFHADFTTPANSTFTERPESSYASPVPVAAFNPTAPAGLNNVPQPPPADDTMGLEALTERFMYRLQYRNHGGFETLVASHVVGAPASSIFKTFRAGERYYELRSTGGGVYSVHEQATFAPADGVNRWMGSAAEDNQGNLAVGYNVSSTTVFPGIRYAGRLAGDPPGGLAQGEATLMTGTGVQQSTGQTGNRWGDYTSLTVDPSDDCTFWYTAAYYTLEGQNASIVGWQTRIGAFKFSQCTAPSKGTGHFAVTACTAGNNVPNAIVTIDGVPYGVTGTNGSFNAAVAPGSHTYSVSASRYTTTASTFNVTNGNTTNVPLCVQGVPNVATAGASLSSESCGAPNGVIDPNETVTVSFCVLNNGGIGGNTSNLVGTLQATGGVTNPSVAQSYGVVTAGGASVCRNFTFTASGTCGGPLTASIHLQDGATDFGTIAYPFTLGFEPIDLQENFDAVTPPNLPAGWIADKSPVSPGPLWATSDAGLPAPVSDSGSKALFVDDPDQVSDKWIDSPVFTYNSPTTKLSFRQNFDIEESTSDIAYDACVLEIQINGGSFQDILAAGGSFAQGGYNHTSIDGKYSNPLLPSRPNWSGSSDGFITTVVNLPAAAVGLPVKLRWRAGADSFTGTSGWRVDTVKVSEGITCANCYGPFTDSTLVPHSTPIKAVHISELRSRINAQRTRFGLGAYPFTDPLTTGVTMAKAVHILEMRTALNQAYVAHGLSAPSYTDPGLAAGDTIKAVHVQDLRNNVIALENSP